MSSEILETVVNLIIQSITLGNIHHLPPIVSTNPSHLSFKLLPTLSFPLPSCSSLLLSPSIFPSPSLSFHLPILLLLSPLTSLVLFVLVVEHQVSEGRTKTGANLGWIWPILHLHFSGKRRDPPCTGSCAHTPSMGCCVAETWSYGATLYCTGDQPHGLLFEALCAQVPGHHDRLPSGNREICGLEHEGK